MSNTLTMTRPYQSKRELIAEREQKQLDKKIESSPKFGTNYCPGREPVHDSRDRVKCKYEGIKDCGRPIVNSISHKNHEVNTHYCVENTP